MHFSIKTVYIQTVTWKIQIIQNYLFEEQHYKKIMCAISKWSDFKRCVKCPTKHGEY